jgi:YidC/Oxa1 family membrane protein insertase
MPKKNLVAFIVVTVLLIAGWAWTRSILEDQRQPQDDVAKKEKDAKDLAQAKDADKKKNDAEPKAKDKEDIKKKDQVDSKKDEKAIAKEQPPPAKAVPLEPAEDIPLGNAKWNYYVLATVTSRGGGICNVTLPKFKKADWNGREVLENGKPAKLELLQYDSFYPSFLINSYPNPASTDKPYPLSSTLGQRIWKVDSREESEKVCEVSLSCSDIPDFPDMKIIRTYTLKPREYHIGLSVEIKDLRKTDGTDKSARAFRYQLAGGHGTPIEGEWYNSVYRTPMIGIVDERNYCWRDLDETQLRIAIKDGGDKIVPPSSRWLQYAGVATGYFSSLIVVSDVQASPAAGGVKKEAVIGYCRPTRESEELAAIFDRVDEADPKLPKLVVRLKGTPEKLPGIATFLLLPRTKWQIEKQGFQAGDHVCISVEDPEDASGQLVATTIHSGNVTRNQIDDITVRVVSNVLDFKPGDRKVHNYLLYHGPSKVRLLAQFGGDEAVDPALVERYSDTLHLQTLTDYRSPGPFGAIASKIMWTDLLILTTRFMHWLLYWLHWLVPNYGLSIMLLTLIVRASMFPISRKSAMLSQKMQSLAPEIKKLQEKHKNDPQAKTAEVMALYRKHGVNPFGSCLPMLMQMPFFLGLYYCLQESINFRLAGFLWIDNLAAPDMLIHWGSGIPIISDPDNMAGSMFSFLFLGPYFNILPVIAVSLMLVQQKMMTPPPADEQQEMQQKMMKYMFVFMGIMFYKVAAGLCIYFVVSSLWGLAERKMLPKKSSALALATSPTASASPPGGGKLARGRARPEKQEKKPEGAVQKVKDWWAEVRRQAEKK